MNRTRKEISLRDLIEQEQRIKEQHDFMLNQILSIDFSKTTEFEKWSLIARQLVSANHLTFYEKQSIQYKLRLKAMQLKFNRYFAERNMCKTEICKFWTKYDLCIYGPSCRSVHNQIEEQVRKPICWFPYVGSVCESTYCQQNYDHENFDLPELPPPTPEDKSLWVTHYKEFIINPQSFDQTFEQDIDQELMQIASDSIQQMYENIEQFRSDSRNSRTHSRNSPE